jgi:hypothetical protein
VVIRTPADSGGWGVGGGSARVGAGEREQGGTMFQYTHQIRLVGWGRWVGRGRLYNGLVLMVVMVVVVVMVVLGEGV